MMRSDVMAARKEMRSIGMLAASMAMMSAALAVDNRPYEFVNAGRTADEIAPWIDFESETGWRGEAQDNGTVRVARSQERQLFGAWTLAVTLNSAAGRVRPAEPLALPTADFDRMGVWIRGARPQYGQAVGATPKCSAVFRLAHGGERNLPITDECWGGSLNWGEWHYVVKRFKDADLVALRQPGVKFDGFLLAGCTNRTDRTYYIDNIAFFRESAAKLSYAPRAQRNLTPLPNAVVGNNTGPRTLSFPTREEGAMPASAAPCSRNAVVTNGTEVTLSYEGPDGRLAYRWPLGTDPATIVARWNGGPEFHPMSGAGVKDGKGAYAIAIRGKTLVIDVTADAGATAVAFGRSDRMSSSWAVPMYYDGWGKNRSRIELTDGVFSHAFADWYRSNASTIGGVEPENASVTNRAAVYRAKTDGTRNPVSERIYLTVSPEFAEVLPVIANPVSPWKHVTGSRAWNSYGSTADRARDKRFWKRLWRYGVRDMVITDHEVCFRDEGESFTFRLDAAPGKGGDAGLRDWTDFLHNELGYYYGPYNNFTDFAPINANWKLDRAGRNSDGGLTPAWMRCYSPKPNYALEACEFFAPRLKAKFGFNTAYCDVHTAVFPWTRTDYDARVPGAATFAQTFYDYGEILLAQRKAWNGPVYSEGTCQYLYAGLTDGNYGQPRMNPEKDPWIVDFNLKRIHPLECDFGMGNVGMFAPDRGPDFRETMADWFVAAELAFGNSPYLIDEYLWERPSCHGPCYVGPKTKETFEAGLPVLLNSYFMALPLAKRYTLVEAVEIRYADARGRLFGTSDAIRNGAVGRNQIAVTYSDGTVIVANGSLTDKMDVTVEGRRVTLPPTGYAGWTKDGQIDMVSSDAGGARTDYCAASDVIYLNTRRSGFRTFAKACGDGIAVCRLDQDGSWELIPITGGRFGFDIPGLDKIDKARLTATALSEDGREVGTAEILRDGKFISVRPVQSAFSYRIKVR